MIVPDQRFVRRLRAQVRATPEFKAERRRIRLPWYRRQLAWGAMRFVIPLAILIAGFGGASLKELSGVLVMWTFLVTFFRAQVVVNALRLPQPLVIFYQLPLSNTAVFRHQAQLVLRGSVWLGLDWLAFALGSALHDGVAATWLVAPILGLTQWAASLAVALTLVRWNPRLPYGSIASLLWFALWIGLQMAKVSAVAAVIVPLRNAFERFTPGGWIVQAGADAASGGTLGWLALIGIGLVAAWLIRSGVDALHGRFSLEPIFGYDETDPVVRQWTQAEPSRLTGQPADEAPLPSAEPPAPVDLPALRERLREELDQPAGLAFYQRGFVERLIARRLTYRQRVLVDFMRPGALGWTRRWLIGLGGIVLAHLLLIAGVSGALPGVLATLGVLGTVPVLGGSWPGLTIVGLRQSSISLHSLLPLGFWELAGARLLISALRCFLALPLFFLLVAFGFTATPLPGGDALAWAVRALIMLLALQPAWVLLPFSRNTNDASSRWWFTLAMILALLGLLVLLIFFIASAGQPGLAIQLVAGAALLAAPHGVLALYGLAYNRGIFDVIGKPSGP